MRIGPTLRTARRRAGLSQRELAERTRVPQSTLARIESGRVDPRWSTVTALLGACGEELAAVPRRGVGVDRTVIRQLLALRPQERLDAAASSAEGLAALLESRR